MRGGRRAAVEEEVNVVPNGDHTLDATRTLMEMMETMRRRSDEQAEEFRRRQG